MIVSPAIILVRPQLGENIGAAARVMKNFGLTDLRLVAPRDGWPNPAAESMAAGGSDLLNNATIFSQLHQAVSDLQQVYATTARPRDLAKPCISAHDLTAHLASSFTASPAKRVGILFGPERSGLENEDLVWADHLVYVPVDHAYPSLNLAQTVAIIVYELSKMAGFPAQASAQATSATSAGDPACRAALHPVFDQLEAALDARNFWRVAEKKPHMWRNLRTLFMRAQPSHQEIQTLHGLIRSLIER